MHDASSRRRGIAQDSRRAAAAAPASAAVGHAEWLLDEAVEATFPASDPPATSYPGSSLYERAVHERASRARATRTIVGLSLGALLALAGFRLARSRRRA